jgi:hypothetical protein
MSTFTAEAVPTLMLRVPAVAGTVMPDLRICCAVARTMLLKLYEPVTAPKLKAVIKK